MNSLPDSSRLNKNFYTKMSATATKQFSEEMQKRRKPFLPNEAEPINARISIKKSNKENTVRPSSPYNKNHLNKTSPGKNFISTTQYRTNMNCPVLHKYHHNSSKALREIDSNFKATYPDFSPGKIEIENIPIKSNCIAKETDPISNYQGKTSIGLYQARMQNNENENFTSDVEQLLKMHKEMTELKQKLEEKYENTLKHRDQLISSGTYNNGTPETDNIMATIHETILNEAPNSQTITPTNLQRTSELLTTTTLLSLAKANGMETQSQQHLSLITDEPCNAKRETLNETVKLFTQLFKPKETNGNEMYELQTFTKVTSKESLIAAETGNRKRETLIRKINLLRQVMVITSRATSGNDISGYQSLTADDFNNYRTERLTNSTPLTATAMNAIEKSGNEALNKMVGIENIEDEGANSSLFATIEAAENEINEKIYLTAVKEETKSPLKTPAETSHNETARSRSLFALNEALKNAKTLAENLESLTNIIGSCTEEKSGFETNSSRSLSLVTKDENKLDIEGINRCLELLINEFFTTTETDRIETTGHNSTFCIETNANEINSCQCLGLISKEINNIGEENLNTVLNFLKTTIETSGNETAKYPILKELNKEKYNFGHLAKNKDLQALQITNTFKETSGIETPRFLTQLIPQLNKTQNVSVYKAATAKKSNGNGTPQSLKSQHLRQSRLKRNLPYICNKIKTISQIPNEIIKIPKRYLTYRAQNTENSLIYKENGNEAMASQGDDGEKETRIGKNARLKLKIPINLKNFVNPKSCMSDEEQKGRYEMEHFKQIERKDKAMAELLDKDVTKGFPNLREGAKNKQECGPKQINVEQYGGMLYGLWDAVKKFPFEGQVNFTTAESKNDRKRVQNKEEITNRGENREMEIGNEEIFKDKREEKINARERKVEILKEKREDEIKEREKKCEKNKGEIDDQSEIIAKKELEKQEVMPKGSQYSNVEKIPKKKYSFRKSLRNYFVKEEKTNATDAKNTEENCATQDNDTDDRNEIDRMAEHFTQIFHI